MSLQDATDGHRSRRRSQRRWLPNIRTGEYAVSGSDIARIERGSTAEHVIFGCLGGGSTSVGHSMAVYTYSGTTVTVTEEEYDPAFVAEILAADAAPPEASFNNVVDMLDWLNRD